MTFEKIQEIITDQLGKEKEEVRSLFNTFMCKIIT